MNLNDSLLVTLSIVEGHKSLRPGGFDTICNQTGFPADKSKSFSHLLYYPHFQCVTAVTY